MRFHCMCLKYSYLFIYIVSISFGSKPKTLILDVKVQNEGIYLECGALQTASMKKQAGN